MLMTVFDGAVCFVENRIPGLKDLITYGDTFGLHATKPTLFDTVGTFLSLFG